MKFRTLIYLRKYLRKDKDDRAEIIPKVDKFLYEHYKHSSQEFFTLPDFTSRLLYPRQDLMSILVFLEKFGMIALKEGLKDDDIACFKVIEQPVHGITHFLTRWVY